MGMEAKPTVSLHEGELRQTWIHGIHENEYVKEGGKSKLSRLFVILVFRTQYEDGWLKVPVVGQNGEDKSIASDGPPTAYRPYPSGYHVPFSPDHPIKGK